MTLAEIELMARRRYNAVGDDNWSSAEICELIYQASLEITRECGLVIERKFQTTSVASTGEYDFPDQASAIKRITYNGQKLKEITMRDDDAITLENQLTTDTGIPIYYYVWNRTFNLRPLPSSAVTIEVFAICNEDYLTTASATDIPDRWHGSLVTYCIKEMASKDLNWAMYDRYDAKFEMDKIRIRAAIRREKRGDAFRLVQLEENLPYATLGTK